MGLVSSEMKNDSIKDVSFSFDWNSALHFQILSSPNQDGGGSFSFLPRNLLFSRFSVKGFPFFHAFVQTRAISFDLVLS